MVTDFGLGLEDHWPAWLCTCCSRSYPATGMDIQYIGVASYGALGLVPPFDFQPFIFSVNFRAVQSASDSVRLSLSSDIFTFRVSRRPQ